MKKVFNGDFISAALSLSLSLSLPFKMFAFPISQRDARVGPLSFTTQPRLTFFDGHGCQMARDVVRQQFGKRTCNMPTKFLKNINEGT